MPFGIFFFKKKTTDETKIQALRLRNCDTTYIFFLSIFFPSTKVLQGTHLFIVREKIYVRYGNGCVSLTQRICTNEE